MAARIISIINPKGRVGKSTLAMILAEFLAFQHDKKVLLMDMDAQGGLTDSMVPADEITNQAKQGRTSYHMMKMVIEGGHIDISQYIAPPAVVSNMERLTTLDMGISDLTMTGDAIEYINTLDMIISVPAMAELEGNLLQLWEDGKNVPTGLKTGLPHALQNTQDNYDYILIDCPPTLSPFSSAALIASDYYLSPITLEPLSLQGVRLVQKRVTELQGKYHCKAQFIGSILNLVSPYRPSHQSLADEIYSNKQEHYRPFHFWLPNNERLHRISEFDPSLPGGGPFGLYGKFVTLSAKYSPPFKLNNPPIGSLDRSSLESSRYMLQDRICSLVEEFQEKCL